MADFNPKKDRAHKIRQDKFRNRPKKHVDVNSHGGKGDSRDVSQGKPSYAADTTQTKTDDPTVNRTDTDDVDVSIQSFSKRKLHSNWDRYEENLDLHRFENDNDDERGAQFEDLLSLPTSVGGHLKLKHEREWEEEKSQLQMQWFQLDLQAMEKNLSTIPFFKRQSLSRNIFTESQIQHMEKRATQNAASLSEINQGILKIQSLGLDSNVKSVVEGNENLVKSEQVKDLSQSDLASLADSEKSDEEKELDELLALSEQSTNKPTGEADDSLMKVDLSKNLKNPSQDSMKVVAPLSPLQPASSSFVSEQPTIALDDLLDSMFDD